MPELKDFTGQRLGRLTVIESRDSGWSYLCRCDCGVERSYTRQYIRARKTQSCGCLQRERAAAANRKKFVPLDGQRFGLLTVVSCADMDEKHRGNKWNVRCDCGTEMSICRSMLNGKRAKKIPSCGCEDRRRRAEYREVRREEIEAAKMPPEKIFRSRTARRIERNDIHPVLQRISEIADQQCIGRKELSTRAGLSRQSVPKWFTHGATPHVAYVTAVANVLGHRLTTERYGTVARCLIGSRRDSGPARYICPDAHPFVHEIVRLAKLFDMSLQQAALHVGIKKNTLQAWTGNRCNTPSLNRADAMLSVFGLRLALEPIPKGE
jgi:DNA-binding phage protein